jgi:P27 family predicted phage terminase small subunit
LTAAEKKRFDRIATQLDKLGILGETDTDTLARYVTAQVQYEKATKELRTLMKSAPDRKREDYYEALDIWTATQERLAKLQDRYFKQAQTAASALGLTISSRCKLVAPKVEEAPKENKFARFGGEARRA